MMSTWATAFDYLVGKCLTHLVKQLLLAVCGNGYARARLRLHYQVLRLSKFNMQEIRFDIATCLPVSRF